MWKTRLRRLSDFHFVNLVSINEYIGQATNVLIATACLPHPVVHHNHFMCASQSFSHPLLIDMKMT